MAGFPALPPGAPGGAPRAPYRLPSIFYLLAAGFLLWAFSGFTLWVFVIGLGSALVMRLVIWPLFPPAWRKWMGPSVLAVVFLFLISQVSIWALGITLALIGAVFGLRRLPRWHVLAVSLSVLLGCLVGYLFELGVQKRTEREHYQQTHDANVARLRPPTPQRVVNTIMKSIAGIERPEVACFQFSDVSKAQFVVSVPGAADCAEAIQRLSMQVKDKNAYMNPDWKRSAVSIRGERATVDACSLTWKNISVGRNEDLGPKVGMLTLARQFQAGWIITAYEPCE